MAGRIGRAQRVIVDIAVAIEFLRIRRPRPVVLPRNNTIRTHEPCQHGIVIVRMIVQQPGAVQSLAGVVQASLPNRARAAHLAPRGEVLFADHRAAAVGGQADAAKVVAVQLRDAAAAITHGDHLAVEAAGGAAAQRCTSSARQQDGCWSPARRAVGGQPPGTLWVTPARGYAPWNPDLLRSHRRGQARMPAGNPCGRQRADGAGVAVCVAFGRVAVRPAPAARLSGRGHASRRIHPLAWSLTVFATRSPSAS
jgi:hypothetical protein